MPPCSWSTLVLLSCGTCTPTVSPRSGPPAGSRRELASGGGEGGPSSTERHLPGQQPRPGPALVGGPRGGDGGRGLPPGLQPRPRARPPPPPGGGGHRPP